jgi:Protein of unknown function (DUF4240)
MLKLMIRTYILQGFKYKIKQTKANEKSKEIIEKEDIYMSNTTQNIKMDENEFWKIIDMFDWKYEGNDDKVLKKAINYLSKKSNEEIFAFEDILSELLYNLDGIEYARNIGEDAYVDENTYFSVDSFLYSRCVVVANGRALYYEMLNNPDDMPEDVEFESLLYIAREAYEKKNDEEFDYVPKYDYETYSNEGKWK